MRDFEHYSLHGIGKLIKQTKENIEVLSQVEHPRSTWSIEILERNLKKLERIRELKRMEIGQ